MNDSAPLPAAPTAANAASPPPRSAWLTRPGFVLALIVLVALVLRLPFLMHSLDELDSSNFAMGTIKFFIPLHQPHPPGQFYYMMLCKGMRFLVHDELTTLSLLSALFSSLALVPYFFIMRLVFGRPVPALAATALTAFSFGFWVTGLRPISDPVGCFFVYGTICALLYGLDRPGWFYAGMGLFAFQLGVKQLSVYFLAPFVLLICLIVLFKHGWRVALAGGLLFAAVFLGWLVPTVLNCGGWQPFLDLSRRQQAETYENESLITHLSGDQAAQHAAYVAVGPWGWVPLAVVMIVLAGIGIGSLARRGLRARLFLVFGLTTLLYIFCVLSTFSKYYVYTTPIYCALAVAALESLGARPVLGRLATPPRVFAAAVVGLLAVDLGVTLPLLGRINTFRSPVQAAYEYLVRQHGPDLRGVNVITNHGIAVPAALRYYRHKSGLNYADERENFDRILPELNAGRPLYIFSFMSGGDTPANLELIDTYVWDIPLRKILQGWPIDHRLYLYKVHGELPPNYALQEEHVMPPLFARHLDADGWAGPDCDVILPCDVRAGTSYVRLQGHVPDDLGLHFPINVRYEVRGAAQTVQKSFTIAQPPLFDVLLALNKPPASRYLDLHIQSAESGVPSEHQGADSRRLAWQLTGLQCTSAGQTVLVNPVVDSWYDRESSDRHSWRWCRGEGKIEVAAAGSGTLVINATLLATGPERVDVTLDGAPAAAVDVPGSGATPPQTLRVPMAPGVHTLAFHGQQPGQKPSPDDNRLLSVGVQDLQVRLEQSPPTPP